MEPVGGEIKDFKILVQKCIFGSKLHFLSDLRRKWILTLLKSICSLSALLCLIIGVG